MVGRRLIAETLVAVSAGAAAGGTGMVVSCFFSAMAELVYIDREQKRLQKRIKNQKSKTLEQEKMFMIVCFQI